MVIEPQTYIEQICLDVAMLWGATHEQQSETIKRIISLTAASDYATARTIYSDLLAIAVQKSVEIDWLLEEMRFEAYALCVGNRALAAWQMMTHGEVAPTDADLDLYNERLERSLTA